MNSIGCYQICFHVGCYQIRQRSSGGATNYDSVVEFSIGYTDGRYLNSARDQIVQSYSTRFETIT
jgi:hypothetical protein